MRRARCSTPADSHVRRPWHPTRWTAEHVKVRPDGAHLAALEGNDLVLYDIRTGARTRVASDVDPYASPIGWTGTGDAVLFGRTDAEGSSLWRYTGGPAVFLRGGSGLSVSRDGATFSFSRTIGAPGATGVYVGGLP